MGTGSPVIIYYDVLFGLSLLLTGIYMFKWNKHFDVHITLVFALVPVNNLGNMLLARATDLTEAVAVNKLTFIGGCYLELLILLMVFSLCEIRINRFLKVLLYLISTVIFFFVLTGGYTNLFYKSVTLIRENGFTVLKKEYGWMHMVLRGLVFFYFLMSLIAIVHTFIRKNQISRKMLFLLFLPEVIAMIAFFGGRQIFPNIELLPAAFVIAQVTYLRIASRIYLYDVADSAIDSMVQTGETGFISIDFGYHYLASNETAKEIFPGLRLMTADFSIKKSRSFSQQVMPWLEAFNTNEDSDTDSYEQNGRIYQVTISWLYNNHRKKGYQLTVRDDTKEQNYIRLINNYNGQLEEDVRKKTAHIEEMHDQLILGMATMVESRDNSTGGHIRRTSEGVRILLEEMGKDGGEELTPSFREKLIKAAPMHDLGKIAVDDEILRKPGRFTPEEFEKMKAHAAEGARIVHEILKDTDDDEFHLIAENVAHYHHERWDGSGYPQGLKGEQIPREARIMAIADVYDALVSKRVYKESMPFEKADQIMMEGMGSQFAPEMRPVYCRARPKLEAYYLSLE